MNDDNKLIPHDGASSAVEVMPPRFPALDLQLAGAGVWGRKVGPEHGLGDGDRVEVYRPLRVDPKFARRERFRKQGVRAAGLFARRTVGKPPSDKGES